MFKSVMIKGVLIVGGILTSVIGEEKVVTELHQITEASNGEIRGEFVIGTGEGIFYYEEDFAAMGIKDVKVGERYNISWSKKDFDNENWENIHSLEKKSKFYVGKK